jgi:Cu-processing system ATP-binding protein
MTRGRMVANGSLESLRQLAQLPARVRLTMANGDASSAWLATIPKWRRIDGQMIEFEAVPEHKIDLLRQVTGGDAPVVDVDVMPPSLDELYAHFLRRDGGP